MEKILPKASDIRGLLLVDGTEMIAKCQFPSELSEVIVTSPIRVITRQTSNGPELIPVPFSLIAPTSFSINNRMISSIFPVTCEMEDYYIKITTGIDVGSSLLQG